MGHMIMNWPQLESGCLWINAFLPNGRRLTVRCGGAIKKKLTNKKFSRKLKSFQTCVILAAMDAPSRADHKYYNLLFLGVSGRDLLSEM